MELTSLLASARAQGPIFWAASGAIALGLTLLLVAILHRLPRPRRRPATSQAPSSPAAVAPAPAAAASAAQARAAYQEPSVPGRPGSPAAGLDQDPAERSLALLLRRLQGAGDRLEELASEARVPEPATSRSGLKDPAPDVEYVFRACGP